jgi:hypothetical protein
MNIMDYKFETGSIVDNIITINYKPGLKKIDFQDLIYRVINFEFNLKINDQIYPIKISRNQNYQYTFDYDDKKKLNVKFEYKKFNDNFNIIFTKI